MPLRNLTLEELKRLEETQTEIDKVDAIIESDDDGEHEDSEYQVHHSHYDRILSYSAILIAMARELYDLKHPKPKDGPPDLSDIA